MIDTHIHLTHHTFDGRFPFLNGSFTVETNGEREQLITKMQKSGLEAVIEPAIGVDTNERILKLAEAHPGFVFAAIGVHPTRTFKYTTALDGAIVTKTLQWKDRKRIKQLVDHPAVVAVGETGLDFHHKRSEQHRLRQAAWFIWQIMLADKKNLPLVLHVRKADHAVLFILRRFRDRLHGGVAHCFHGDAKLANSYTDLGFMLGIGGTLLTDSPELPALEQAVIETNIKNILLETDGPYVKPPCPGVSKRQLAKVRNTSLILPAVAKRIGELKGISTEEVLRVTAANANFLFHLGKEAAAPAMPEALKEYALLSEKEWAEALDFPEESLDSSEFLKALIEEVQRYPMLPASTEETLLRKAAEGDSDATDALMGAYGRLMLAYAKRRFVKDEDDLSEMLPEGWLALLQGPGKYQPDQGEPYAVFIAQLINRHLSRYKASWAEFRAFTRKRPVD